MQSESKLKDVRQKIRRPAPTDEERKRALYEQIEPVLSALRDLSPGDAADFVAAVVKAADYIQERRTFHYYTDSTGLSCLIGVQYVYEVKQYRPTEPQGAAEGRRAARQ